MGMCLIIPVVLNFHLFKIQLDNNKHYNSKILMKKLFNKKN